MIVQTSIGLRERSDALFVGCFAMPLNTDADLEVSLALRTFTDEYPYERRPLLRFIAEAARATPAGARVADVGAGRAPYRELFAHAEYVTIDWENSEHDAPFDVVAPAHDI